MVRKPTSTAPATGSVTPGAVDASTITIEPTDSASKLTTLEAAELLGISIPTFQKRLKAGVLKPTSKDGRSNFFDLDEVLEYAKTTTSSASSTIKVDPLIRMKENAASFLARGVTMWWIANKDTGEILAILPGHNEQQAAFNAKRRYPTQSITIAPYEASTASGEGSEVKTEEEPSVAPTRKGSSSPL